jgi:hypothetical protein
MFIWRLVGLLPKSLTRTSAPLAQVYSTESAAITVVVKSVIVVMNWRTIDAILPTDRYTYIYDLVWSVDGTLEVGRLLGYKVRSRIN